MIPVLIEEYIKKLLDKSTHSDRRQFYYDTLIKIRDAINNSISIYEKERRFKK
jgi:hypothetical protein